MTVAGARPAAHWDATFDEALASGPKTWAARRRELHRRDDVQPFYAFIENLFHNGITGGLRRRQLLPDDPVTRAQMAVFLLKASTARLRAARRARASSPT